MTEPAHNLRLGHSIKKRRTELGWERSQLRVEIGERLPRSMSVSDDAIGRLEHGLPTRISHNPVVLAAIADALGLPLRELDPAASTEIVQLVDLLTRVAGNPVSAP